MLSIARRKAGTQVECPKCGYEVTVPDEDAEPEPRPAAVAPTRPVAPNEPAKPQPAPRPTADRPLFEHSDFARLLDAKVRAAAPPVPDRARAEPPSPPSEFTSAENGVHVSRGTLVILGVVAVILIALAFGVGFLVGS
jgi:hypothetical protein